jgi:signal transduction histidine kinase
VARLPSGRRAFIAFSNAMAAPERKTPRGWPAVLVAFALVAGALMITNGLALYEAWQIHARVKAVVADAMASVELAERMGATIYRRRLLVDAHVFEKERDQMEMIHAQIAALEGEYVSAAEAYASHVGFLGEADAWRQLHTDVAAIQAPMARALALSHENRDAEARSVLRESAGLFSVTGNDVARLVQINQSGAHAAVAKMEALQRLVVVISALLALAAVALTVFIGMRTSRLVRQREERIAEYAAQLETKNRELDAFAGRVAHDLRTPLSTIKLTSSVLAQRTSGEPGPLGRLNRAVQTMEALIDDLLALARVEAGASGGSCDPAEAAARLGVDLGPRLDSEHVELRVAVEPSRVQCSEGLFGQVLMNLADNALKYRRGGVAPELAIEGKMDGARYRIRVCDNGVGMSDDEARQAFEPFYRARRVEGAPGTGLGLSIVKRAVEASGGTISIDSALGRGTTFVIELLVANGDGRSRRG